MPGDLPSDSPKRKDSRLEFQGHLSHASPPITNFFQPQSKSQISSHDVKPFEVPEILDEAKSPSDDAACVPKDEVSSDSCEAETSSSYHPLSKFQKTFCFCCPHHFANILKNDINSSFLYLCRSKARGCLFQ